MAYSSTPEAYSLRFRRARSSGVERRPGAILPIRPRDAPETQSGDRPEQTGNQEQRREMLAGMISPHDDTRRHRNQGAGTGVDPWRGEIAPEQNPVDGDP